MLATILYSRGVTMALYASNRRSLLHQVDMSGMMGRSQYGVRGPRVD